MKLNDNSQVYIPDGVEMEKALSRTNILCIAAHQDDTEIMAYHAIEECYRNGDRYFASVIVADGGRSPRTGKYTDCTDEELKKIRANEQNKAAKTGEYSAQIQLGYPSSMVKENDEKVINDIISIIKETKPEIIYTHNLADKHKTHVAVALRVIKALQSIKVSEWPQKLIGLEVWRGLDWLNDENKEVLDASRNIDLAKQLLEEFQSQIAGGKRYDKATIGRRRSNATFFGDHRVDDMDMVIYGIDMTELMNKDTGAKEFILKHIEDFKMNVVNTIDELL